jgi:hypothetical protein
VTAQPFEPVPDEFLADMIRLGAALGEIDQADADALLAPSTGESSVKQDGEAS